MIHKISLLVTLIISSCCYAQNASDANDIQKYQKVVESNANDTIKIKALKAWNELTYLSDPELDLVLNLQIDSICDANLQTELSPKLNRFFLEAKASATNVIGVNYYYITEYDKAIDYYQRSFEMQRELGNLSGQANAVNNVGVVYSRLNEYDKALDYYKQGLELRIEARDSVGIAGSYSNMSTIYQNKGDYFKAVEYLNKESQLNQMNKDSVSLATSYINIGAINFELENYDVTKKYFNLAKDILVSQNALRELPRAYNGLGACFEKTNQSDSALYYYNLSIEVATEFNNFYSVSQATLNKAFIFMKIGDKVSAEKLVRESKRISEEIGYKMGVINSLVALGDIMIDRGDFKAAEKIGEEVLELLDGFQVGLDVHINVYKMVYDAAKGLNNYQGALKFHELYVEFRDSLMNNTNQKLLLQNEFKSQVEADSIKASEFLKVKDAELQTEKSENSRRKQQGYYLIGGLGLTLIFGLFVLNRYRLTRRQNRVIEEQKHVVEAAHEEIKDSIEYAKRIQSALLPPMNLLEQHIPDSFIYYLPKDVVAGDFYWMEPFSSALSEDKKGVLIAAADCTGHGVPGALVSVLCSNALSRSTREYGLTDPGLVLNKTREIIIDRFSRSEEHVNDGMDIALVSIEKLSDSKTRLKYAGANNPLWIIRNGSQEIEEIKATKQPVGNYAVQKDFQTHTIELDKGDQFYLFSDGYADQFGGEKGKKLKNKSFKDLLVSIKGQSIEAQQAKLASEFKAWRGAFEQIDDVLVMGVRV